MSFHDINHCIIINFFPLSKSTIAATSPIFLIVLAPNWTGLATDVFEATKNNLGLATIALGAGGLVAVAAPGVVVAPVIGALHCVGFGTGGIVSGS